MNFASNLSQKELYWQIFGFDIIFFKIFFLKSEAKLRIADQNQKLIYRIVPFYTIKIEGIKRIYRN